MHGYFCYWVLNCRLLIINVLPLFISNTLQLFLTNSLDFGQNLCLTFVRYKLLCCWQTLWPNLVPLSTHKETTLKRMYFLCSSKLAFWFLSSIFLVLQEEKKMLQSNFCQGKYEFITSKFNIMKYQRVCSSCLARKCKWKLESYHKSLLLNMYFFWIKKSVTVHILVISLNIKFI